MKDEIFPQWGDLDDGKESVWACEWFIDENQDGETVFMTVQYKFQEEFVLSYKEIDQAIVNSSVQELLASYIKEDITDKDLEEIVDFFNRWLSIVDNDGHIDVEFDDEDVSERDEDYVSTEYRTLH
ncbi:hypothetical protein EB118_00110 [bacterium]|nr:hypothetical protein [bacterium]